MCENLVAKSKLPEWLTDAFLADHLRNYYQNDGIKLIRFDVKSGAGKDEGFMSSMLRVKVTFGVPGEDDHKVSDFFGFINQFCYVFRITVDNFENFVSRNFICMRIRSANH